MTRGNQPRSTTGTLASRWDDLGQERSQERTSHTRTGRQAAALLSVCLGFFVIQLGVAAPPASG